MDDRKNLAAYTPPGSNYPPYISINKTEGEMIEVTVRSPANEDGTCGSQAAMKLNKFYFSKLVKDAIEEMNRGG